MERELLTVQGALLVPVGLGIALADAHEIGEGPRCGPGAQRQSCKQKAESVFHGARPGRIPNRNLTETGAGCGRQGSASFAGQRRLQAPEIGRITELSRVGRVGSARFGQGCPGSRHTPRSRRTAAHSAFPPPPGGQAPHSPGLRDSSFARYSASSVRMVARTSCVLR